jgi:hypothetical protein
MTVTPLPGQDPELNRAFGVLADSIFGRNWPTNVANLGIVASRARAANLGSTCVKPRDNEIEGLIDAAHGKIDDIKREISKLRLQQKLATKD